MQLHAVLGTDLLISCVNALQSMMTALETRPKAWTMKTPI